MPLSSMWELSSSKRKTPKDYPRIYLFGDSLTERAFFEQDSGFGWKLEEYYTDRVEVINEGYSGETTRSLRRTFDEYILDTAKANGPPAPLFVTIFLGANDGCLIGNDPYVPIAEYEDHIRYYVKSILTHPATQGTKVILISPPPIDVSTPPGKALMGDPAVASILRTQAAAGRGYRTWESKRRFAKKIVEIGQELQQETDLVAVLDFWTVITKVACQAQGNDFDQLDLDDLLPGSGMPCATEFGRDYFTDGLHLGDTAYQVLDRELRDLILTRWPGLKRDNFPTREIN